MEVEGISGPVTLVMGYDESAIKAAAKLTLRYSDAPGGVLGMVKVTSAGSERIIQVEAADDDALESLRIKGAKIRVKKTNGSRSPAGVCEAYK